MSVLPADLDEARRLVLAAAQIHVPFEGWGDAALVMAAEDLGVDPDEARLLFPRGAADMIEWQLIDGDQQATVQLAERDLSNMRVRDRIALAVRTRLEIDLAAPEAMRRTASWLAMPQNAARALRAGYRTVDALWAAVGDQSTDFNYYTKRALLLGVQTATVLYALGDMSEDHAETWAFLDRRIADVMRLQTARGPLDRLRDKFRPPTQATP